MSHALADALNRDCRCISVDHDAMVRQMATLSTAAESSLVRFGPSSLFASVPVFVARTHVEQIEAATLAIERAIASVRYQSVVLAEAASSARHPTAARGLFFGYDFHLGPEGPSLIEINTNAGGALLNLLLARAQRACCDEARSLVVGPFELDALEEVFVEAFRSEWRRCRGSEMLHTLAIVDDEPERQFLYLEFLLFQGLLRRSGFEALIVAPEQLRFESGALWAGPTRIDFVYNRLVDFYLEEAAHRALREAYLAGAVVVTPHPRAHALYADKNNLVRLCDPAFLAEIGIDDATQSTITSAIPETVRVRQAQAERFWRERRQWFFKPVHGYGSKAAYRGDKLTRSVFAQILASDYVAQRIVPPTERHVETNGRVIPLKLDIRAFVCDGNVLLCAARLYHGQTTNFRTPGGGFAPVFTEARSVS
jgi:hypothetical protein